MKFELLDTFVIDTSCEYSVPLTAYGHRQNICSVLSEGLQKHTVDTVPELSLTTGVSSYKREVSCDFDAPDANNALGRDSVSVGSLGNVVSVDDTIVAARPQLILVWMPSYRQYTS